MVAATDPKESAPRKSSKLPLILGVVLLLAGGVGGYFAISSGMIGLGGGSEATADAHGAPDDAGASDSQGEAGGDASHDASTVLATVAFVTLDPLVISLSEQSSARHLRFRAVLDVPPEFAAEVEAIRPRIIDVLNGYLRAVEPADLEDPTALIRLRAQMLRRVQVVAGEGRVRDLLVQEFVLD